MRNNVKLRLTRSRFSCFALHCYISSFSASWLRRFLSYAQCVNILQTSCDANQHHFADDTKLAAHSSILFLGQFRRFRRRNATYCAEEKYAPAMHVDAFVLTPLDCLREYSYSYGIIFLTICFCSRSENQMFLKGQTQSRQFY